MAHPKGGYWVDGVRVPSVTKVIGQMEKPALIPWAAKLNRQLFVDYIQREATAQSIADLASFHGFIDKALGEAPTFRSTIEKAADAGTVAHDMIERWIKGTDPTDALSDASDVSTQKKAEQAFESFLQWIKNYDIHIIGSEENLISDTYAFGGTPDAWGRVGLGSNAVFDWKTGSGIYAEALIQVSAYAHLVEQREECKVEQAHILRFSKKTGAFTHQMLSREQLDAGWKIFMTLLDLHSQREDFKEMMK